MWKFLRRFEGYVSLINSTLEDVPELPGTHYASVRNFETLQLVKLYKFISHDDAF